MTDVARIGIQVDADGAIRQIKLTSAELANLANQSVKSGAALKQIAPPSSVQHINTVTTAITQQRAVVANSIPQFDRMRGSLTQIAISAAGIPGPLGRLASVLSQFAVGGAVTIGLLAGIAAITYAWRQFTEESRKAEEMMKQLQEREKSFGASALRARIASLEVLEANQWRVLRGTDLRSPAEQDRTAPTMDRRDAEHAATIARLGELRTILAAIDREGAGAQIAKDFDEMHDAIRRSHDELNAWWQDYQSKQPTVTDLVKQMVERLAEAAELTKSLHDVEAGGTARDAQSAREQQKRDLDEILFKLHEQLDVMKEQEEAAKRQSEILRGAALGSLSAVLQSRGGVVGALGGGLSGALGGISGGAVGIVAGGFQGLLGGLLALGEAAKRQAEHIRELRREFDSLTDQLAVQIGAMSAVEARQRAITREYAEQRDALDRTVASTQAAIDAQKLHGDQLRQVLDLNRKAKEELAALNAVAGVRIALLQQEIIEYNKTMMEDLEVRRLRALGFTEEADALEFALKQQREFDDVRKRGATEATLAALEHVQALEKLNFVMAKIQSKVDELNHTIEGLSSFRNTLLLSDAKSPTAQLDEARRQYEEILKAAQGGDQAAAGRLPAAAQAFLEFSRAVNASGAAFQADFLKVLNDTNGLIQLFQDQKTIFEQQLDVLKQIRDGTYQLIENRPPGSSPGGPRPTIPNAPGGGSGGGTTTGDGTVFQAQLAVLQSGFQNQREDLALVRAALGELATETRRGFESVALNSNDGLS